MQRKRPELSLIAAVTVCLLCGLPAASAADGPITLAGVDYLGDLPTHLADRRGLFTEELGPAVTVRYADAGRDNLASLLAGEVTFATMALTPIVIDAMTHRARAAGNSPVILAGLHSGARVNGVYVPAASRLRRGTDLAGARIGYMPGTNAEMVWWHFAAYHGLDPNTSELVPAPIDALPSALADGRLDAAVLWEPWPLVASRDKGLQLRRLAGSEIHNVRWVIVARRDTALRRPTVTRAVLSAYRRAVDSIEREPEAANAALAARLDLPPEQLARRWEFADFDLTADWTLLLQLQQIMGWMEATGQPVEHTLNPAKLFHLAPLREVHPSGVSILQAQEQRAPAGS